MQAGWLRHRIELRTNTPTRNAHHEEVASWATTQTVWGSVEPLRGRELYEATQEVSSQPFRIRIRFNRAVTSKMRARWTDETDVVHDFQIESVVHPLEKRRETHLMCRELSVDGEED